MHPLAHEQGRPPQRACWKAEQLQLQLKPMLQRRESVPSHAAAAQCQGRVLLCA